MKSFHHISLLISSLLILASSGLLAQPRQKHPHHEELRKEVHAYAQSEIIPILQPQREKLDNILSSKDQNELQSIRRELKTLREQHASRPSPEDRNDPEFSPSPEQREAFREMMKSRRLLMTRAWAIADAYETEIQELLKEIEPQTSQWHKDLRSIKESHRPEGMSKRKRPMPEPGLEREDRPRHAHKGYHRGQGGKGALLAMVESPVRFLLWDPTEQIFESPLLEKGEASVFPNPSTHSTTLTFEIKQTGKADIQLIDPQGNVIRTMEYSSLEAGKHSQQIDTHQLEKGVYIIRIRSGKEVQTKKLVVE